MTSVRAQLALLRPTLPPRATLLAVTKGQPIEKIREALREGVHHLGVNYVQEGEKLRAEISGVKWHFIGQIQSRKVKFIARYDRVESVDRLSIAEALNQACEGRRLEVLIQLNIGEEATKGGIAPADLPAFASAIEKLPNLECRGLMLLPPPLFPVEQRAPFFRRAKDLLTTRAAWDALSMGTSEDYEVALREGSTTVRLGRVLFGDRA